MAHPTILIGPCFTLALEKPGPLVPARRSPATFRGWVAAPGEHRIDAIELQFGPQSFAAPLKRRGDVRRAHPKAATAGFEVRIPVAKVPAESVTFAVTIDGDTHFVSTRVHVSREVTSRARDT
jgi:hypothetical protein